MYRLDMGPPTILSSAMDKENARVFVFKNLANGAKRYGTAEFAIPNVPIGID